MQTDHYPGVRGTQIFYRHLAADAPKAGLIIVHGYAEHSGRYAHVMERFAGAGWSCWAQDHRGHGKSARVMGLIESFEDVVEDLRMLHRRVREALPKKAPIFVWGHSGGGLATLRWLQRSQKDVQGAILTGASALVPSYVHPVVIALSHVLGRLTPKLPVQPFWNPDNLCRDKDIVAAAAADPLMYKGKVRARTGSELIKAMRKAAYHMPNVTIPLLVLHGEEDKLVDMEASEYIAAHASSHDLTFERIPGAKHELHNDPPAERAALFDRIEAWMNDRM